MKSVFILCSLFLASLVNASPMDSIRTEQRENRLFIVHQVEEEETLYAISKRYNTAIENITLYNQISDNYIAIGQLIYVEILPKEKTDTVEVSLDTATVSLHKVQAGETLYRISKKYEVKLKDLRKWNNLDGNDISPDTYLVVSSPSEMSDSDSNQIEKSKLIDTNTEITKTDTLTVETDPLADFEKYLVQTGETLATIARRIGVEMDSLRLWNGLSNDYLKIGQQLFFKPPVAFEEKTIITSSKDTRQQLDEDGFERVFEEGVASVIQSMNTTRFLALHSSLPIGTDLEVRNLMNNHVVHVKVVGKLPKTGLNKNLLVRLSQPAYDQLGILDSKSRVEVSYSKK